MGAFFIIDNKGVLINLKNIVSFFIIPVKVFDLSTDCITVTKEYEKVLK